MPGLLRGVARTAVIAGTATAVSNRVSRRQGRRWAVQEQQQYESQAYEQQQAYAQQQAYVPPPTPPAAASSGEADLMTQLRELGELKDQGVLTEAEFEAEKAKILASLVGYTDMLTGKVAIHATAPTKITQPMTSIAVRAPRPPSLVLIPEKNKVTANSTTPST